MSDQEEITPEGSSAPVYRAPQETENFGPDPVQPITITQLRRAAYIERADPLFFKWQRGEATEQDWLDEVAAIRDEFSEQS